jgi:putative FmdB family regulatory protein
MPTYEYRCENDHLFEVMQRMSDDPLEACTVCGAPVQRIFHPVAVHFKGSGFYSTDYGKKKKSGAEAKESTGETAKSDSSSSSNDSKGSDSKGSDSKSSEPTSKASSGD